MPPRVVLLTLAPGRLTRRYDPNGVVGLAVRMHYEHDPKGGAEAEQNEPIFRGRVVWVLEKERVLVSKDGLGLLERDPVFVSILGVLPMVPLKPGRRHASM
jgi:hypothetical protein